MQDSLQHLPRRKQRELTFISKVLREYCQDVQMVILYGSYARNEYKEAKDIRGAQTYRADGKLHTAHVSDYDILVVTSNIETARALRPSDLREHWEDLSADPQIITCDIESLNQMLKEGQYFYSDIRREGICLYNSEKYKLNRAGPLTPERKQAIAQGYYDEYFTTGAKGALEGFDFYITKGSFKWAAFLLHQAAEHAYKAIILVFTSHNPQGHFLEKLSANAQKFAPDLAELFVQNTPQDKDRYDRLEYAYIGARYDPKYSISKQDLEILESEVKKLFTISQQACLEKIKSLNQPTQNRNNNHNNESERK